MIDYLTIEQQINGVNDYIQIEDEEDLFIKSKYSVTLWR